MGWERRRDQELFKVSRTALGGRGGRMGKVAVSVGRNWCSTTAAEEEEGKG